MVAFAHGLSEAPESFPEVMQHRAMGEGSNGEPEDIWASPIPLEYIPKKAHVRGRKVDKQVVQMASGMERAKAGDGQSTDDNPQKN